MLDRLLKFESLARHFVFENPRNTLLIVVLPTFLFLTLMLALDMSMVAFVFLNAAWLGLLVSFCLCMMLIVHLGQKREQQNAK